MGVVETLPAARPAYAAPRLIDGGDALDGFDCGKPPLNDFLKQRALKNEGKASRTYVVLSQSGEDAGRVIAYYTLASGAVSHSLAPGAMRRNMPDPVPVTVLGRLAVDNRHAGRGLGGGMLREAFRRTIEAGHVVGTRALIVHAVDDEAITFYTGFGFRNFPTDSRTLFLPLETISSSL